MESWSSIIIAAVLAEAVWETAKLVWQKGKMNIDRAGALAAGLLIALGTGLDVCAMLGLNFKYAIIGEALTGVLLSRGANFAHDLFSITQRGAVNLNK